MEVLSASDLFAIANGCRNEGNERCYWCGSKCKQLWRHYEPALMVGVRSTSYARIPSSPFICAGCWHFRRKRVTVTYVDKTWLDGQTAENHSWWITSENVLGVNPLQCTALYEHLLKPPHQFVLSLVTRDPVISGFLNVPVATINRLQCAICNNHEEIKANTPLQFTLNNIIHTYTIYELEEALKATNENGWEPGVRALIQMLGRPAKEVEKREVGRPVKEETHEGRAKKTVTSGNTKKGWG